MTASRIGASDEHLILRRLDLTLLRVWTWTCLCMVEFLLETEDIISNTNNRGMYVAMFTTLTT